MRLSSLLAPKPSMSTTQVGPFIAIGLLLFTNLVKWCSPSRTGLESISYLKT